MGNLAKSLADSVNIHNSGPAQMIVLIKEIVSDGISPVFEIIGLHPEMF